MDRVRYAAGNEVLVVSMAVDLFAVFFGGAAALLSLALLFVAGICDGLSVVIRHAILRLASPEEMRGRIAAVRMVFVSSSNELGAVQMGLSAALLGPTRAVVLGGILTLGVVGIVGSLAPKLRNLDLGTYGQGPRMPRVDAPATSA